jgi:hypothetical protein
MCLGFSPALQRFQQGGDVFRRLLLADARGE